MPENPMGQKRRSSKDEYTILTDMLHISVSKHLLDEHFTVIWANNVYYELIGYPREEYEALYQNQCDLFYADHQDEWNRIGAEVVKALKEHRSGYTIVTRMPKKGGFYTWVNLAATFTDEYIDGYQVSYTVMTDIDDVMRMKLEQSVTYENLPGFVAKFRVSPDLELTLLDANDRFINFFGDGCWGNMRDSLFRMNMEQSRGLLELHRDEILKGSPIHLVCRMRGAKGEEAWLQVNAECIDWQGENPVYLALYIDITNETELRLMQKKLEDQAEELRAALKMAEHANRAKSDFLSRMSHDIRTPMNAIVGMTEIAAAHLGETERVRDCLKKISLSSKHLLGLINDVLDMSAIESGKMTSSNSSVSLPEFMEGLVAILRPAAEARRQKLFIRLNHIGHERLYCDALRLRQVLINILSNASKFTPEGGSISLELEELPSRREGCGQYRFICADNGRGMSPEFLEHIFDSFTRERDSRVDKIEGSGLGMAITKKIVDMLGGTIRVDSRLGEGTTFTVDLPLRLDEAEEEEERFDGVRILVADDDPIMCEYAVQELEELGVSAQWTDKGREAVEKAAAASEQNDGYHAVILDWKMPDMNGLEVVRRLRAEIGDEIPLLIVSAYDWSEIEEEAIAAGVSGFLPKPLFKSTLRRAIRTYVIGEADGLQMQEKKADSHDLTGRRILLAEDNELNREIAVELLSDAGAEVDTACDGVECCRKYRQSPEGYYDIILMDVQMPEMNGYEATRSIRGTDRSDAREIPIWAMTADAFAEDVATAMEAGMNGHFAKPLDMSVVTAKLDKVLGNKTKRQEGPQPGKG